MDAAEDFASLLHAVPDYPATAVRTNRRQGMDRALEAIERVVFAGNDYFKRLVIFIFANFACSHTQVFRVPLLSRRCPIYSLDRK
jgi:hypothetical protein